MFITFEGIEGSGKTTQIRRIATHLKQKGHDCVLTREPGGTRMGEKIRAILLDPQSTRLDPLAELLLYMADRAQHINQIIRPNLEAEKIVLCDRYFDATVVYQGYARGLDLDLIRGLHRLALGDLKPDATILMDLEPEIGLARAWKEIGDGRRADVETRFEKEALQFHAKVRAGYLNLAKQAPARFTVVNAAQDPETLTAQIVQIIDRIIDL